jgi:hypothetical protein
MTKPATYTNWTATAHLAVASPCRANIVFAQARGNHLALAARSMR